MPRMRTWLTGVAKVESMQTVAPAAWHRRAMRRTSTQRRYGLVGDSEKNSVTSRSCSVASSRPRSDGSITYGLTAHRFTACSTGHVRQSS